jgi:hypothetical protein
MASRYGRRAKRECDRLARVLSARARRRTPSVYGPKSVSGTAPWTDWATLLDKHKAKPPTGWREVVQKRARTDNALCLRR